MLRYRYRAIAQVFIVTVLMVFSGSGQAADPYKQFNAWPSPPKMIAGKPYSITPGPEAGTYLVKWGDQQMIWKPKDYMDPVYKKMGPAYYSLWTQPEMPAPWDVPLAERDKLPGDQWVERCFAEWVYPPFAKNYWDELNIIVYRPDGAVRGTTDMLECSSDNSLGNADQYFDSAEKTDVLRKYVWEFTNPSEVRGEGGVTTQLKDLSKAPQDTLYLPTVQKVRRLAGAVSKQWFPGLIYRYEDVSHVNPLPDLDYKVVGYELFDATPDKSMSYKSDHLPDVKRIDGSGEVMAKIEITPKPGISWWYAKRYFYCGVQSMAFFHDNTFDANGKMLRKYAKPITAGSSLHMGGPDGPPAPNWWAGWGTVTVEDLDTGYSSDVYPVIGGFNGDFPDSVYTDTTLYREPKSLNQWVK